MEPETRVEAVQSSRMSPIEGLSSLTLDYSISYPFQYPGEYMV
jgi:hypothetical protein